MLQPIAYILAKQRNILASSSPRRSALLKSIGLNFEIIKSEFNEDLLKENFSHPCEYVKENAKQKAIHVWNQLNTSDQKADLVIGADTIVTLGDTIYEKPKDSEDAFNMLSKLSGQWHTVFTGVALVTNGESQTIADQDDPLFSKQHETQEESLIGQDLTSLQEYVVTTFHEATDVYIAQLTPNIIKSYIETGEPMDKAGAYAIQGIGSTLIEQIKGDFFNVVGLPLHRLSKELYHMYSE